MGFYRGPHIVTDGLVLALDAANPTSYPGSGTTWRDLSGNNNSGSLVNGPTFNSVNGGSIVFDGSNDYVNIPYAGNTSNSFTFTIVMKCNNMDSNTSLNRQTLFGLSQNGNAALDNLMLRYGVIRGWDSEAMVVPLKMLIFSAIAGH